jgi:hypothetical protein
VLRPLIIFRIDAFILSVDFWLCLKEHDACNAKDIHLKYRPSGILMTFYIMALAPYEAKVRAQDR